MVDHITSIDALRSIYSDPAQDPLISNLMNSTFTAALIENSPFMVLGTVGDVSPKGDHPGFVKVLNGKTLGIPDRKGNNRLDSLKNVIVDSQVALIFIPGINETLRVNGHGKISTDPKILKIMHANGELPYRL